MNPIPFVNSETDVDLLIRLYSDAPLVRISNDASPNLISRLPKGKRLWVDPAFDGFHTPTSSRRESWNDYIRRFPQSRQFDLPSFLSSPERPQVEEFVEAILDDASREAPDWLSIPQFPLVDDTSRNRINRELALAATEWRSRVAFKGKLVLPIVITNQRQTNSKTERNKKLSAIRGCLERGRPEIVWLVDSSLQDQAGTQTFQRKRFPGIISFHEELEGLLPQGTQTVGGPYWGLNMILWARNKITFPAIGLGAGYQYHIAGGPIRRPKRRLALGPLRRWAIFSADLKGWLSAAISELPRDDAAGTFFAGLLADFDSFHDEQARLQVATFYRGWHDRFGSAPAAGRALKLYQDLSSAYVLGKALPNLPRTEGSARKPEIVAQQFMLNCL